MDDLVAESAGRLFADWTDRAIAAMPVEAERGDIPFLGELWRMVEDQGFALALLPEAAGGFGIASDEALRIPELAAEHGISLPLGETMLANWLLATAGLDPAAGPATFGLVAVDGATVPRLGWARAVSCAVLVAEDAAGPRLARVVPQAHGLTPGRNILGEPRDGLRLTAPVDWHPLPLGAETVRAAGAMLAALAMAGALHRVLRMCLAHAAQREQFGKPLGRFQVVQHNLARMASQTAAATTAARGAARAFAAMAEGRATAADFVLHAASAKIRTGEAAGFCAAGAHQLHGAIGFSHEFPLHVWTRRLWSCRDEWGSEAEWSERLGRRMLAAPDLWGALTAMGEVVA